MNEDDLSGLLRLLLALPAETEAVEFKEAKNTYDIDKLGKYFSALSNEANVCGKPCGWLVFGVNKNHQIVGTQFRPARHHLDNLKTEIAAQTTARLSFVTIHELHHPQGRVLMFEIPAAPPGIPTAWKGHFYGREGESIGPLTLSELERIRSPFRPDWSAQVCEGASLNDLLPSALDSARERYKEKHPDLAQEMTNWSDIVFLNKAKITINGKITRTAILLLGREESAHWLTPAQAQMTWVLKDSHGIEEDYQHLGPPFLLNTEGLFKRVRNLTYRYLRDNTLFPTEVSHYDPWVIRELLHNCIAHQDYTLKGRISVIEQEDALLFTNLGGFIPQSVEQVIEMDAPPDRYRNPFLAQAMVGLNMIDTIGSGIRRVFRTQQARFFPLPDYDLKDPQQVKVRLFGKILDENYTRALIANSNLDLHEVMALDRVQKRLPITDKEFKRLKNKRLVEGRRPMLFVAASVAKIAGSKAAYIRNRAFDKSHYKRLVTEYLHQFGGATPTEIEELLIGKLPDMLDVEQKKNKIRNLLQEMARKDQTIRNTGGRGARARWVLNI
ncbi:MAG: putative DNA binding domain-containing protein [Gammaproteobacteria bacterium]